MKLNRDSWLVKLAYLLDEYVPEGTSVCRLFWRLVFSPLFAVLAVVSWIGAKVFTPVAWMWERLPRLARVAVGALLAGPAVAAVAAVVIEEWLVVLMFLGCLVLTVVTSAIVVFVIDHLQQQRKPKERAEQPPREQRESVVTAYLKAKKQRFCPRVEFV